MDLAGLFLWSFLAATILPLGSEPALAMIVSRGGDSIFLPVTVATLGNYLGSCTTYALAVLASKAWTQKATSPRAEKAAELIRRYGAPALLLSWIPLLGDGIVAAAGVARVPLVPFSAWTIAGKAARYIVVALIAARLR